MIFFGSGNFITIPVEDSFGNPWATPTPVRLGGLQDISVDIDVDLKTLYGSRRYPIAVAQGKAKIEIKAKYAEIDGAVLGRLQFGKAPIAGIRAAVHDFAFLLAAGAEGSNAAVEVIVEPPHDGTFVTDLGVVDGATGEQLERVPFANDVVPAAGEYAVLNGKYRFAPSHVARKFLVSFEYRAESANGRKGQIFELTNDLMGPTPAFTVMLQNQYGGKNLVMKLNRAVSSKVSLPFKSDDFAVYDLTAQAFADEAGSVGYIALF
jgi:hypothetical protein